MSEQLYICHKAIENDCRTNSPYCTHGIPHYKIIGCRHGQCGATGKATKCIEFNFNDMITEGEFQV